MKGNVWFLRRYGLRNWLLLRKARKEGWIVNYAEIFTPEELALIGEHFVPCPWET